MDSSCDLPDETIDRHRFVITPIQISDQHRTYLDRIDIRPGEVYRRMRSEDARFTTSQPTPAAFAEAYRDARSAARQVLCLALSAGLSGTFASAQAAAATLNLDGIRVMDSRTVSLGLGMLALRARELADDGLTGTELIEELVRVRDRSGAFVTVDNLDALMRSGRVSWGHGWVGNLLHIKPILELTPEEGKVHPIDRVRGRKDLIPRVLEHLSARLTPRPKQLRVGIAHADAPETAHQLQGEVEARFHPRECLVAPATAALGVHVGPGAWAVFYQVEEPAAGSDRNISSAGSL